MCIRDSLDGEGLPVGPRDLLALDRLAPVVVPATFEPPRGGLPVARHALGDDRADVQHLGLGLGLFYCLRKSRKLAAPVIEGGDGNAVHDSGNAQGIPALDVLA